jgi:hypothetical protein
MRTTLTLEPDVAAALTRLRNRRKLKLKEAVNAALREGLARLDSPAAPRRQFRTKTVDLGPCLLPSLDNIAEVIEFAEGANNK